MILGRYLLPLTVFVIIVVFSYLGLGLQDREKLPSALIGKQFPDFATTSLFDPETLVRQKDLIGRPTLVNVWATWCPTCKSEHQELIEIAEHSELYMVGINYKDNRSRALSWLTESGNPFDLVLEDKLGDLGVELGVYGAPETFLLDKDGFVVYKRVGDITQKIWLDEMLPIVQQFGEQG